MAYNDENYIKRVHDIVDFARQYYEPGRQDRSWHVVWRIYVKPKFNISLRTFKRYLKIHKKMIIK
jgi:hypothetical protein